ncbi:sensor histidine kinase [Mucilaginibacter lacusdianchii]|uniref:sensor histidine kinase n=1 Tax=Mucilaginibacter lacusdianchii TaxID=2684211 RepID=UPI00131C7D5F|nr:ATP-binding protein [Mucilaginibacter sp. JXJ CY 39]
MHLFPYLAAFLLAQHIQKNIKTTELYPKWRSILLFANWGVIVFYLVVASRSDNWFSDITGSLVLWGYVTYINRESDFRPFWPFANTHYPLILASGIYAVAEFFSDGSPKLNMYYQFMILGAFMWIFGRGAAFKKQQKQVQIVTEKNSELETLVALRTAELTRQKNELQQTVQELKATQAQLIQQEKLASLGELTAGIAHEIQNPLNFVNNFSEVSAELIDELEEELNKGDKEEAIAIAEDIKQNLEKIRHHGKRADGIVKGMLQHSRASTGQKEPTDINVVADEYLRLAYHGLRAKDKMFNAELIANLDGNLPKINIVPQDIGRVLLNLFTNAFYATHQKRKTAGADYKPTVALTTATTDNEVVITVKDNGTGIPEEVRDKIMQPFFTTKPTGEGTGLGLSLSYDIVVKGHGGTINVESEEGEYTQFTISLPR